MKIKQMIKWNWQNSYMGLIVLYGVFILLYLFAFAVNVSAGGETVNVNGMSTGSVVMMLVYGIVLFSQSLRFGLGNGVSRRTVFLSFLAFFGIFSVCMTVGDVLLQLLVSLFTDNSTDVLLLLFGHEHSLQLTTRLSLMGCLLAVHLAFGMIGYFIGGAYYRMGKYLRLGVSIGVPAFLFVVLPILVMLLPAAAQKGIFGAITAAADFLLLSPLHLGAGLLTVAAAFGVFAWLFIRRAPIKAAF